MNERFIVRRIGKILNVSDKDITNTLLRFKKEIEEMKKELGEE